LDRFQWAKAAKNWENKKLKATPISDWTTKEQFHLRM
jgi:hypothetical protein